MTSLKLIVTAVVFASTSAIAAAQTAKEPIPGQGAAFIEKMRAAVKERTLANTPKLQDAPAVSAKNAFKSKAPVVGHYTGILANQDRFELHLHEDKSALVSFNVVQRGDLFESYELLRQLLKITNPDVGDRATPSKLGLAVSTIDGYQVWTIDTPDVQYVFQPHWTGQNAFRALTMWTLDSGVDTTYPSTK